MTDPNRERDAASYLRRVFHDAEPSQEVLDRIVRGARAHLNGQTAERAERGWKRALFFGEVIVAAAAVALVVWWAVPKGPPALARGDVVETAEVPRVVAVGPHVLHIGRDTRVRVENAEQGHSDIRLSSGAVIASVSPLRSGESFEIRTAHLVASAIGTKFRVIATADCSRVEVDEGIVLVQARGVAPSLSTLRAGEQKRVCDAAPEGTTPGENLVRDAVVLISHGRDAARAESLLRQYLDAHANGPFAEDALYHLCILEARRGATADADETARQFLSRFPNSQRAARLREWLKGAGAPTP